MNRERAPLWLFLLLAPVALAQEPVTFRPPARDVVVNASGERIDYRADGTCVSTVVSTVNAPSVPLVITECNQSRARARAQLGAALDAGALFP